MRDSRRPDNDPAYLPPGYHEYFCKIYRNRTTAHDVMSTEIPNCAIRIVSGHGFPVTRRYTMRFKGRDGAKCNIPFTDLLGTPNICQSLTFVALSMELQRLVVFSKPIQI